VYSCELENTDKFRRWWVVVRIGITDLPYPIICSSFLYVPVSLVYSRNISTWNPTDSANSVWPKLLLSCLYLLWGVDYEKPMRPDIAQLCPIISRMSLAPPQEHKKAKCSTAPFLHCLLQRSRNSGFSCCIVMLPPWELLLHLLVYYWILKTPEGGQGDWLVGCWVMLEVRGNMRQCKSEHQDFKKS
jgi:hypothetical protein